MAALGDEIERILATIRAVESDGNYQARSATSSASGAYQFTDPTWRSVGGTTYASHAYQATPAEQDAVARAYVQRIIATYPSQAPTVVVPRIWYVGTLDRPNSYVPLGNKLSVGDYAMKWLVTYAKTGPGVGVADAITAPARKAASEVGQAVTNALGDLTEPFLTGLRRIAIVGVMITAGVGLVVAGAWRGVKAGG